MIEYSKIECFRVKKLLDLMLDEFVAFGIDENETIGLMQHAFENLDRWEKDRSLISPTCASVVQEELDYFEYQTRVED